MLLATSSFWQGVDVVGEALSHPVDNFLVNLSRSALPFVLTLATTIALVGVTWAALKERQYSAVMAATGLLYLAILTAFGMDVVGPNPRQAKAA